jgi:hypothetical protein
MAHFAEIDSDNKVVRVLVVDNELENRGSEYLADDLGLGGIWIQTSYNNKIRNKFAGVGDIYDEELDAFIPAQPYPSWIRDGLNWKAPKEKPEGNFDWDESTKDWVAIGETL